MVGWWWFPNTKMPLASENRVRVSGADAACCGVRLALAGRIGAFDDTIVVEPAHLEWLVRIGAWTAVRNGEVVAPASLVARVLAGAIREWHGSVQCLESIVIELRDTDGRLVSLTEFSRRVLQPFVAARAVHHVVEAGAEGTIAYASSLHAVEGDDDPWPVDLPALPAWSIDDLAGISAAEGTPAREWIATFVHPDVLDGLAVLERASREQGVEAAGRLHTRIGFDRETRAFVRVLEQLVVTRDAVATGASIVSSAASWGDFLAAAPCGGAPSIASHVHTHLHLAADGVADEHVEGPLPAGAEPLISIRDRLTHLTRFTDVAAVAAILSLYPDQRVVDLYGYQPSGTLEHEPGYWVLPHGFRSAW